MKKSEMDKLDRIYQIKGLEIANHQSILGGKANCIHHILRKPLSLRWYYPAGVPLTLEQHNIVHSSDKRAKMMEYSINNIIGLKSLLELQKRKHIIVKNLTYDKVLKYLNGEINDYI